MILYYFITNKHAYASLLEPYIKIIYTKIIEKEK